MNYSNQIRNFAQDLVSQYQTYDRLSKCYGIHISDIPEYDLHQFAAMIMASDNDYASEATGADNPAYQKKMLPALLTYLNDTTNPDNEINFNNVWREGITGYFLRMIQEILDIECDVTLYDHGYPTYDREVSEPGYGKYL